MTPHIIGKLIGITGSIKLDDGKILDEKYCVNTLSVMFIGSSCTMSKAKREMLREQRLTLYFLRLQKRRSIM